MTEKNNTTEQQISIADNLKHCSLPLIGNSRYMCYVCLEFVTNAPKKQRTTYGFLVWRVGFCFNKNCFTYFREISNFGDIKTKLVDKNMKKTLLHS